MTAQPDPQNLSLKRKMLCNRLNAQRVASRMFDNGAHHVSIVRTTNPLQPFRVVPEIVDGPEVELEMRLA